MNKMVHRPILKEFRLSRKSYVPSGNSAQPNMAELTEIDAEDLARRGFVGETESGAPAPTSLQKGARKPEFIVKDPAANQYDRRDMTAAESGARKPSGNVMTTQNSGMTATPAPIVDSSGR